MKITKAQLIHHTDNGDLVSAISWDDGSMTQGKAEMYYGLMIPSGTHMGALFDRALREGIEVQRHVWTI